MNFFNIHYRIPGVTNKINLSVIIFVHIILIIQGVAVMNKDEWAE